MILPDPCKLAFGQCNSFTVIKVMLFSISHLNKNANELVYKKFYRITIMCDGFHSHCDDFIFSRTQISLYCKACFLWKSLHTFWDPFESLNKAKWNGNVPSTRNPESYKQRFSAISFIIIFPSRNLLLLFPSVPINNRAILNI